jgi:hypothetical protein
MGQSELDKVERQRGYLHETLLRIGGAIQVLEELLAQMQPAEGRDGTGPGKFQPEPARTPRVDARHGDINRTTW